MRGAQASEATRVDSTAFDSIACDDDDEQRRARLIAFYLPQFHPIPENDEWWGPGFTEWTNVARARPLFPGHVQPHLPADLGFYDLRVPETRQAQADLARRYGVTAFCYWHYWFAGRRMLDRPFEEVRASGEPDLPFCLAWANQSWTGAWHGAHGRVLIEQTYPGSEDDRAHFEHLLPAFGDRRYLTVEGRPLFYVFRPEQLPDPVGFTRRWREMARASGFDDLYLVAEISDLLGHGPTITSAEALGFDAGVYVRLPTARTPTAMLTMRTRRKMLRWPEIYAYASEPLDRPPVMARDNVFPCVYPNWDNTPRSGRHGLVLRHSGPDLFRTHLRHALDTVATRSASQQLVFVKSWNEWAEGNYLEPDLEHGHAFLDVIRYELAADHDRRTP